MRAYILSFALFASLVMIAFVLYSYVNCLHVKDLKVHVPQAEDTYSSCDFVINIQLFNILRPGPYSADIKDLIRNFIPLKQRMIVLLAHCTIKFFVVYR